VVVVVVESGWSAAGGGGGRGRRRRADAHLDPPNTRYNRPAVGALEAHQPVRLVPTGRRAAAAAPAAVNAVVIAIIVVAATIVVEAKARARVGVELPCDVGEDLLADDLAVLEALGLGCLCCFCVGIWGFG
jgi:hypothetical protein